MVIFKTISLGRFFSPSHSYSEPCDKSDRYDLENFKQCKEDFVDEMNGQSSKRIEAANDAINDWNSFVFYQK